MLCSIACSKLREYKLYPKTIYFARSLRISRFPRFYAHIHKYARYSYHVVQQDPRIDVKTDTVYSTAPHTVITRLLQNTTACTATNGSGTSTS